MSARDLIFLHYLTAVFDHIDEAVLLIGVEAEGYRALFANEQLLHTVGYSVENKGKLVKDIVTPERYSLLARQFDEVVATKEVQEYSYTVRTIHGMRSLRSTLIPVLNSFGTCTHIVALLRNVTEAKQEKHAFNTTLEALAAVEASLDKYLLVMTKSAVVRYVSPLLKQYSDAAGLEQLGARLPAKLSALLPDAADELTRLAQKKLTQCSVKLRHVTGTRHFLAVVTQSSAQSLTIELQPQQ